MTAKTLRNIKSAPNAKAAPKATIDKLAMPLTLAFTSAGDRRYQTKVDLLNALAAKGDVKGLKAVEIKPYSSSPKKMLRWRDQVVAALEAGKRTRAK